jgi:hypothetical protein
MQFVVKLGDEVEDVSAVFAFAETMPDILADAHPELRRVAASMDRTRALQAIGSTMMIFSDGMLGDCRFAILLLFEQLLTGGCGGDNRASSKGR